MKMFALIFVALSLLTGGITVGCTSSEDTQQAKIVELEKRIAELECRHVMYEDGSTTHADAERVAECVYTAPVFAKYGD